MVRYALLIFFTFGLSKVNGQNIDYSKFNGDLVNVAMQYQLDKPYFQDYKDNTSHIYPHVNKASPNTIEGYLYNLYVNGATEGHSISLSKASTSDTTLRNFLLLQHKLTFYYNGKEIAILKFNEVKDSVIGKPQSASFIRINENWKLFTSADIGYTERVIGYMKTSSFWEFYNKSNGSTDFINRVKKSLKTEDGILNISLLSAYLDRLKKENPQQYFQICDR